MLTVIRISGQTRVSYYDGDPWSNHVLNEVECAECEEYFDQQEEEGGKICPPCVMRERAKSEC